MTPQEKLEKLAEEWFELEKTKAYKCCEQCGQKFSNSEIDSNRGFKVGYTTRDAELSAAAEREKVLVDALKSINEIAGRIGLTRTIRQGDKEYMNDCSAEIILIYKLSKTLSAYSAKEIE